MRVVDDPAILALVSGGADAASGASAVPQFISESTLLGAGYGASKVIVKAGGFSALSETSMIAVGGTAAAALAASFAAGWQIGSYSYESSTLVQKGADTVVTFFMDNGTKWTQFIFSVGSSNGSSDNKDYPISHNDSE